jgi:hypothetical protein
MAVSTPGKIQISAASALKLPEMAQEPLKAALKNLNYLIKWHRPPLVDDCPMRSFGLSRTATYTPPITPSADGLRYTFETRWICSAAAQSVTVTVDWSAFYNGGATAWTNIFSQATVSGAAGILTTQTKADQTIPPTAEVLRYQITSPASGTRDDHHLLVYPSPADTTAGALAGSGAVPFDDGGLAHADEWPVHTEFINRCKVTAVAVLIDRWQRALSMIDEEATAGYTGAPTIDGWHELPPVRCYLPFQGPSVNLEIFAIAEVTGGTTAVLRIGQVGGNSISLSATGQIDGDTLEVKTTGTGEMAHADLRVQWFKTAGQTTYINAIAGYYIPGA